jgi:hypothetical protein
MLRELASRAGSAGDAVVRDDGLKLSYLAHEELMHRGDAYSVPFFVSNALDGGQSRLSIRMEDLEQFPKKAVAAEVKMRLDAQPSKPSHVACLLTLLGKFGTATDAESVEPFLDNPNELARNVAYETKLRLADPLRLASDWYEILVR